ncbi:transglycosylase SLT domain-containing protein [Desulfovibrio sp. OttesenSCG-928-F07]|nr:transglycosylase SLT domain-containing protein [Desulfovibrio sp. OttesenSCG-928-F07]
MIIKNLGSFIRRCLCVAACIALLIITIGVVTAVITPPALEARQFTAQENSNAGVHAGLAQNMHSPVLRIVVPYPDNIASQERSYGPGMEAELLKRFIEGGGYRAMYIFAASCTEGLDTINNGRADIMVGFGGIPAENYSNVTFGPPLATFNPVIVAAPATDAATDKAEALHIPASKLNRISYSQSVNKAATSVNPNAFLVEPATYALLVPLHNNLETLGYVEESSSYHWFWNAENEKIAALMQNFWAEPQVETMRAELSDRYYGFIPATPKQQTLKELAKIINKHIGAYSADIAKAAAAHDIDPLLLSAVIFQESRFNPNARSYTGVRGIMQLTLDTASMLNVNRMDPTESIMGGARYLRSIKDSIDFVGQDVSEWDKWCLTLAGFNQGPTVLRRALRAAGDEGKAQTWASMRSFYPGLKQKGLAGSGFRAKEAINYVENIRYYYYILSGLANIAHPEHTDLAGLRASIE